MPRIDALKIKSRLTTDFIGKNIIVYDETDSTNTQAKLNHTEADGTVFIAESQRAGRGSRGREWVSKSGVGIWMSVLLKPDIPMEKVSQITLMAGLAVKRAIGNIAIIKWPNDVVSGTKKICGILTEMSVTGETINGVVCGIGINVNDEQFGDDISHRATSLFIETGKKTVRNELVADVLNEFEEIYKTFCEKGITSFLDEYRSSCITLGKEINVIYDNKTVTGFATDIADDGSLIVRTHNDELIRINSGEVSVRGIYGYV